MNKINKGDRVKSHLSLWKNDIGTVSGIIPIWSLEKEKENCQVGNLIHVIFPETDKHEAYQQSFNEKDLELINK